MVKEFFIKGTNKQYSINELGVVYSNYKTVKSGKKIYKKVEKVKHKHLKGNTSIVVSLYINKKTKTVFVNSLMRDYFKLSPPDKFHFYDLVNLDGDNKNNSLSNLQWKVRLLRKHKFEPKIYYKNKTIISKCCGECGVIKEIKHFHLQPPSRGGTNYTYRNICERCRGVEGWNRVKSNPILFKRHIKRTKGWAKSKDGKKYYYDYRVNWSKEQKTNITRRYAFSSIKGYELGLSQSDMTNELYEIIKKKIKLNRIYKNEKT